MQMIQENQIDQETYDKVLQFSVPASTHQRQQLGMDFVFSFVVVTHVRLAYYILQGLGQGYNWMYTYHMSKYLKVINPTKYITCSILLP